MAGGAIDIHTHIVPASFPAYAGGTPTRAGRRWRRSMTATTAT